MSREARLLRYKAFVLLLFVKGDIKGKKKALPGHPLFAYSCRVHLTTI